MLRGCLLVYVTEHFEPLLAAQIDNPVGIEHLKVLDPKTGRFERVTGDAKQIDQTLKKKTACWIYMKTELATD